MNWRKAFTVLKWATGIVAGIMLLISALLLIFKDDIKAYALEEANKYLNKRVHIGYIDVGIWKTFPDLTLSFDDVLVHSRFDTLQTMDTAVYAKKINLRFNVIDFFSSKYDVHRIDINHAKLYLKILEDGRVNYDFLKPSDEDSNTPFEFNLKNINLSETDFSYVNESTQQFYTGYFNDLKLQGSFNEKQFVLDAKTNFKVKSIQSKSLTLIENQDAKCDILIQMDQINNVFEIKSADLSINKLPFLVKGKVSNDSLDFYIGAKNLNLAEVAKNFTLQELNVVDDINGKGRVNFELFIKGSNEKTAAPAINAKFDIVDGSLSDNGFELSKINVVGSYSNGVLDRHEVLSLSTLKFHTLNEDFDGQLVITDFDKPRMKGRADGILDLKAIHRLFGPFSMQHLSGNIEMKGDFDVRLNQPKFNQKDITIYDLRASLKLNNITAQFFNDERKLSVKNGNITIRNQFAGITDLSLALNQSSLVLDGEFNHLADYFKGAGNLTVDANISSDALYLDDLSKTNEQVKKTKTWLLPDNINGNIVLALKKVEYSGHAYTGINGKMSFGKHQLVFPIIEGVSAGTKVKGKLKITEERPMCLVVETTLNSDAVSFKPLFKEWNNFDQNVITSDNIRGQAAIHLDFKGPFDLYEEKIIKEAFDVRARVRISDGALINVQTFKEITNSLRGSGAKLLISKAKIDDFESKLLNLKFDSFENDFIIKDGVITIPKMTIHSNAIDLNLEGTHSFENDIDYSFDFRFREIKGSQNSQFGDVVDDGTGFRIFLKMFGTIDNPSFTWDKEAKKAVKEEQREQAKDDLKSALKTGFGINKKDTTITELKTDAPKEEKIIMDFGKGNDEDDLDPAQKKKKKNALQRKIDQWKKENEEEKPQSEFEFD